MPAPLTSSSMPVGRQGYSNAFQKLQPQPKYHASACCFGRETPTLEVPSPSPSIVPSPSVSPGERHRGPRAGVAQHTWLHARFAFEITAMSQPMSKMQKPSATTPTDSQAEKESEVHWDRRKCMLPVPSLLQDITTYFCERIFMGCNMFCKSCESEGNWQYTFSSIPVNFD